MSKQVKLVLKGDLIAPEDSADTSNNQTTIHQGESFRFTLGPQFKSGDGVTFDKASPLKDGVFKVGYNTPLDVSRDAKPGSYTYNCAATDLDGKPHSSGGGEIIIISGN
jgi:hypothetical protein